MAGEITLIAKIIPKNDAFTGLVDAKQIIGGTNNTIPPEAISSFSVTNQLDGYLKSTGSTGDGYLCFFTGTNLIAGDNDLRWDRVTNKLYVNNNITKSSGALNIGTQATSSNSLTTGDVVFGGAVELEGVLYLDATAIVYASNQQIQYGTTYNSTTNSRMYPHATNGEFKFALGTDHGRQMVFTTAPNSAYFHGHAVQTNPTIFFHSAINTSADNTQWMSVCHNYEDGYFMTGKGGIVLAPDDGYVMTWGQIYSNLKTTTTPTSTAADINWDNGNCQTLSLASATGTVTVTFTSGRAGGSYVLKVIQHASAAKDITWPGTVKWPDTITPIVSSGASAVDVFSFWFDGTNYYGNYGQAYG